MYIHHTHTHTATYVNKSTNSPICFTKIGSPGTNRFRRPQQVVLWTSTYWRHGMSWDRCWLLVVGFERDDASNDGCMCRMDDSKWKMFTYKIMYINIWNTLGLLPIPTKPLTSGWCVWGESNGHNSPQKKRTENTHLPSSKQKISKFTRGHHHSCWNCHYRAFSNISTASHAPRPVSMGSQRYVKVWGHPSFEICIDLGILCVKIYIYIFI